MRTPSVDAAAGDLGGRPQVGHRADRAGWYVSTVCPKLGASEIRTERGITVGSVSAAKWVRTSSATWAASLVRPSYMVSNTVLTCSPSFNSPLTRLIVRIS